MPFLMTIYYYTIEISRGMESKKLEKLTKWSNWLNTQRVRYEMEKLSAGEKEIIWKCFERTMNFMKEIERKWENTTRPNFQDYK